jgi:molybdopterin molybdotransferase
MLGRGEALSVDDALRVLIESLPRVGPPESAVSIDDSYGRVLSRDIVSPEDLPGFPRSTVDGYAVISGDTFGASEGSPAYIGVSYEILMGEEPAKRLNRGEAARIATGGMLPPGADAVLMLEHAEMLGDEMLGVQRAVAPGENVIERGEDVRAGDVVCVRGRRLRPEDVAVLAGLGITEVFVHDRPRVSIISTGDEVVPPSKTLKPGLVRDMNSYILAGLVLQEGCVPVKRGIVKDEYLTVRDEVAHCAARSGMVLITGGSSVGTRDLTGRVMADLGRVLFHSVSQKPGKPMVAGILGGVPVLGLPGHPRAVSVCFEVFARPVLRSLAGRVEEKFLDMGLTLRARLTKGVNSAPGRQDRICVALEERDGEIWAAPLLGKSGLISTLAEAHGAICVPPDRLGLHRGEHVEVRLR